MPTKRKAAETEFNLDPQNIDSSQQKLPKKFKEILDYQTKEAINNKQKKNKSKLLNLKPGETMKDFSKRVDDTARVAINLAFQKTTKTKQKRTENSKLFKKNMKAKARGDDEEG